ncbi:hypothetical protein DCF79_04660 [Edwardsiella tarda]|uniref:hypothetical protein n=1 Tax=Edwardsiella tarda TaxID=636 RepID=UPI0011B29D0C|nr:hypothetical protein [Edwardsiella tarda]UCQ18721.1 hypothetical protein DCF79_04660 [Edwardsiella tarda]
MANYSRNKSIDSLSISSGALSELCDAFDNSFNNLKSRYSNNGIIFIIEYAITFDGETRICNKSSDFISIYNRAKKVESILLCIASKNEQKEFVDCMSLSLNSRNNNLCSFSAYSDIHDWLDSCWFITSNIISKYRNKNYLIRTDFTNFLIQIVMVVFGFVLSLWVASKIEKNIAIDNSFEFSFLFIFIVFSNVWTYASRIILIFLNFLFPNVKFFCGGKDDFHWTVKLLITTIIGAVFLYFANACVSFVGEVFSSMINNTVQLPTYFDKA